MLMRLLAIFCLSCSATLAMIFVGAWGLSVKTQERSDVFAQDVITLFERCRLAIETATPLDTQGLIYEKLDKTRFNGEARHAWRFPDSPFQLEYSEIERAKHRSHHSCFVELRDENPVLGREGQAKLLHIFTLKEMELTSQESHEKAQDIPHIPPKCFTGILSFQKKPKGVPRC